MLIVGVIFQENCESRKIHNFENRYKTINYIADRCNLQRGFPEFLSTIESSTAVTCEHSMATHALMHYVLQFLEQNRNARQTTFKIDYRIFNNDGLGENAMCVYICLWHYTVNVAGLHNIGHKQ